MHRMVLGLYTYIYIYTYIYMHVYYTIYNYRYGFNHFDFLICLLNAVDVYLNSYF